MEMERRKWIAAVGSIWIQCASGASYAFGIYSPVLKSTQGYDQSTLDTVSVFKDIGANAGILSGLLYSAVASSNVNGHRFSLFRGPWMVHAVGAIQCFIGYFFMWLAVTGGIRPPQLPLMCLFMFLAAHSQTFFNTANIVTSVQNFRDYSGTIIGIMKGFLGLSGSILIQVYQSLFKGSPSTFLLMLALFPTLLSLLLMCLIRVHPPNSGDDKKHLNGFSVVSLIVAAYIMILIILENIFNFPFWARLVTFVILLILLCSPLRIAIGAQREDSWRLSQTLSIEKAPLISNPMEHDEIPNDVDREKPSREDNILHIGDEMNLLQAMSTLDFWLLFVAMVCGMGSGLATINNISQVGQSLDYNTLEINTLVSLWSIWNFLGRFGAGYVSDYFLHGSGWARPFFMTLTLAAMTAGHIVIAYGFTGNLYVGSVLVGICYGSQWSLMPTITSEIFGVIHMGTIFNTISIGSPVGSYIFSVRVIGYIYDRNASEKDSCHGRHCFMSSFLILACVSCLGFLLALILHFRTRQFYAMVLFRRLRH